MLSRVRLALVKGMGSLGATRAQPCRESSNRRWTRQSLPSPDEGNYGERMPDTLIGDKLETLFPNADSFAKLYNGVPYEKLPVVDIKATKNNSLLSVSTHDGTVKLSRSCGCEGFKHAKKGTNIAAQATAITLSGMAIDKGIRTIRVRVGGLGPGRMAAIKGLQMGGMNIVSITDRTRVSWNPPRPRKARRV